MKDVIRFNQDDAYCCINDLLPKLQQAVPSIKLLTYTDQDVEIKKKCCLSWRESMELLNVMKCYVLTIK